MKITMCLPVVLFLGISFMDATAFRVKIRNDEKEKSQVIALRTECKTPSISDFEAKQEGRSVSVTYIGEMDIKGQKLKVGPFAKYWAWRLVQEPLEVVGDKVQFNFADADDLMRTKTYTIIMRPDKDGNMKMDWATSGSRSKVFCPPPRQHEIIATDHEVADAKKEKSQVVAPRNACETLSISDFEAKQEGKSVSVTYTGEMDIKGQKLTVGPFTKHFAWLLRNPLEPLEDQKPLKVVGDAVQFTFLDANDFTSKTYTIIMRPDTEGNMKMDWSTHGSRSKFCPPADVAKKGNVDDAKADTAISKN